MVFLIALAGSLAANAALPQSVADALKKAGVPEQNVALYVHAVADKTPLLSHNAAQAMNTASVMKVVTTHAALDLLTPAYRWKTEIYRDGELANWVLQGDLVIKGYGDPSFKAQDFWRLLISLRQAGVKKISGNLVIDKTYFANSKVEINFDSEKWRAYNATPSAFLVNGRNTSFKFNASEEAVNVSQEFELPEVVIVNQLKRTSGSCGDWRSRMAYDVKPNLEQVTVTFNGSYAAACGERFLELSVLSDEQYAFFTFKKLWRELGGEFNGTLKVAEKPVTAVKLLEQMSEPLGTVVRDINKWSNNVMAKQLLLTLAAEKNGLPVTEQAGAEVIKRWLQTNHFNFDELVIENGSGLSRIEQISAEHLGQLLVWAYNSPIMPEMMASLPILSLDGTVQQRLKDSASNGRAHLKTGSINGVNAIAGYVLDANNHRHVLVMLVNHPKAWASKAGQDALIEWVHKQP
ncbi:MAG: D-alanyl-D-alanine carboxypeptidase/D-alanyl-D-alanine-endopeptidase [Methylotenera sp. 24-45-7]|nr:MAG: D-alanyl-D-alanine carboxypeptidase/D-alanyl-D-alanine-endopeptidase [Methylophilales bacterium 16-45-9]OYZ41811.1 MAG: D-alanyl-D-alanine carboxypeptidase/D-alanyl-D-alanine-endopeptidase [Methylotenera sp. 24-45-7]OZA10074.1 MAG: D-alanyl-D-alanine carboxypeptidase/D-alanyl-D-alanine-endopeptidase [Methylotenera sp. 17-45-7]OZA54202.1 MAG: D-alanyl-D-alanine carboxypeptidase/D-alanyl-D-alanine-endopeptidase [Methylophilales bacterium 39-45-7]HQS43082.1 D-alanyl-D-alanine carboxypeptid